jgi:hypothetical protein
MEFNLPSNRFRNGIQFTICNKVIHFSSFSSSRVESWLGERAVLQFFCYSCVGWEKGQCFNASATHVVEQLELYEDDYFYAFAQLFPTIGFTQPHCYPHEDSPNLLQVSYTREKEKVYAQVMLITLKFEIFATFIIFGDEWNV